MAPTEVAAQNCYAVTMHSACGLPIDDRIRCAPHFLPLDEYPKQHGRGRRLENACAVIRQKASMVFSDNLLIAHRRLQEVAGSSGASSFFGPVNIYTCDGDFQPLAPVNTFGFANPFDIGV